jgi:predicted dehydrogenase
LGMLRVGIVGPTWIGERQLKSYLRVPNVEAVAFAGEALRPEVILKTMIAKQPITKRA